MEKKLNDISISGSGKIAGGEYDNIRISGSGSMTGDVTANSVHISGSGRSEADNPSPRSQPSAYQGQCGGESCAHPCRTRDGP